MTDSPVISTVDYDAPGKQFGRLQIPRSTNESGWSNLFVPLVSIANGRGPTVLVTGGVHGDEPEGQVAALNLARETRPDDVRGRLIIIPCLSPEASRAYTRLWPSGAPDSQTRSCRYASGGSCRPKYTRAASHPISAPSRRITRGSSV